MKIELRIFGARTLLGLEAETDGERCLLTRFFDGNPYVAPGSLLEVVSGGSTDGEQVTEIGLVRRTR